MIREINLGAIYTAAGKGVCRFRVWAPLAERVEVHVIWPVECFISMEREERGYHSATVECVEPGTLYYFRLNGKVDRPDPASSFQSRGVHGPSQVIDHAFAWQDESRIGLPLQDFIFYELHVGTFTPESTFEAVIPRLPALKELGINNLEIMPVSQFPGDRNWGYDGVYPFAVQHSYGGPEGLKKLVNECHKLEMAVTLDVVYNHLGPEGNYLREFGPYFTDRYKTPWGEAFNFDGPYSGEVREFFLQNAMHWLRRYHIDALRLDAVHAIFDGSAVPFLRELAQEVEAMSSRDGPRRYLIAESDLNDSRLIRSREVWGYGLDAQWCDDFHHSVHALLTGERQGYYADFGDLDHLAAALREGYVYSGRYSAYRKRNHGNFSADLPAEQFVVALQNHDQVGNRMLGERMASLVSFEARKLAAGLLFFSPYLPLVFMGEEYGETAPFLYFVSHTDPGLLDSVRCGRTEEFREFQWPGEPPDPADEATFHQSKIDWEKRREGKHALLLSFYRTLIRLRRELPALSATERSHMEITPVEGKNVLVMKRWWGESHVACLFNFDTSDVILKKNELSLSDPLFVLLDSADDGWQGPGSLLCASTEDSDSMALRSQSAVLLARTAFQFSGA